MDVADKPSRACTGLIAEDANGHVMHVANMDQSPTEVRSVTLHVRFVNGSDNNVVFEGADWYWFTTGVSRAMMPGVVSIQENWRFGDAPVPTDEVFKDVAAGVIPQILVFRHALVRFSEAVMRDNDAVGRTSTAARVGNASGPFLNTLFAPHVCAGVLGVCLLAGST
jgi:hypothetical protein